MPIGPDTDRHGGLRIPRQAHPARAKEQGTETYWAGTHRLLAAGENVEGATLDEVTKIMQTEAYAKQAADPEHPQHFPGHAAWIDQDWKLHRIEGRRDGKVRWELYNLEADPAKKRIY